MRSAQVRDEPTTEILRGQGIDMKLEVAVIPVRDVDRAKRFYEQLGWRLDADFLRSDGSRAVQLTPPGSPSSIHLGDKPVLFLVVSDIEAARAELAAHGVDVSEVFHRGKEYSDREARLAGATPRTVRGRFVDPPT